MKSTLPRQSKHSRREFLAMGALLGTPFLGAGFLYAGDALGADRLRKAKPYRVVPDWPQQGCPQYMSRGIDADRNGRIYVSCDQMHPIIMIDPQGKYVGEWGKDVLAGPHGLRVQRDTVWVTDSNDP